MTQIQFDSLFNYDAEKVSEKLGELHELFIAVVENTTSDAAKWTITLVDILSKTTTTLTSTDDIPKSALIFQYDPSTLQNNPTFNDLVLNGGLKVSGNFDILPLIRKIY